MVVACLAFLYYRLYLFNVYNCVWFIVRNYSFILYIFVVLLVYCQFVMDFFFHVNICVNFFCYKGYIFFETYYHIVMVINSKLLISHDILKNILIQNQPKRTLYTTPNHTVQNWGTVWLWFWPNCIVKCSAKNNKKLHWTTLRKPLIGTIFGLGFFFK